MRYSPTKSSLICSDTSLMVFNVVAIIVSYICLSFSLMDPNQVSALTRSLVGNAFTMHPLQFRLNKSAGCLTRSARDSPLTKRNVSLQLNL